MAETYRSVRAIPAARGARAGRHGPLPYLLLAPPIAVLLVLIAYPLLNAVYLSMTRSSFIQPVPRFVGLQNYVNVFKSTDFWKVLTNSVVWTVAVVVFQFVIGMATAMLLVRRIFGRGLLRGLVIMPWIMPGIIAGVLWKLLYDPYLGLVNSMLRGAGVIHEYIAWLAQPSTVMAAVIFAAIWKGFPLSTVLYMAAYQNVPKELMEAARTDGANAWQTFVHVVLPSMAPTIRTTVLLTTVFTFNYFDLIYVTTGGGPGISSQIFPTFIYRQAFVNVNYGLAATYGIISVIVLSIFSVLYLRQVEKAGVFEQ